MSLTSNPRSPEGRIHALDALRAVAMFLGIVLHGGIVYATALPIPGLPDVSRHWGFDVMFATIHGFRMHLFFFLSGFFARLVCERLGPKAFMKQRLKRIGLPFAVGMVTLVPMVIVLAVWGFARAGQSVPIPPGARQGLAGIPTMHLWFLWYLLWLYAGALGAVALFRRAPPAFLKSSITPSIGLSVRRCGFLPSRRWRWLAFGMARGGANRNFRS